MKIRKIFYFAIGLLVVSVLWVSSASALPLNLDSLNHGDVVTNQFAPDVNIWAKNYGGGPNRALIFDSTKRNTRDPDLEDKYGWSQGNLKNQELGNLLIVQENYYNIPDDEAGGGSLLFKFEDNLSSFGFDIVDVEGGGEPLSFHVYEADGTKHSLDFSQITNRDNSISWGDNSANRIAPITAADFGLDELLFNMVEVELAGSGAVGNVNFTPYRPPSAVPEPTTMLLVGAGLLGLVVLKRRSKS